MVRDNTCEAIQRPLGTVKLPRPADEDILRLLEVRQDQRGLGERQTKELDERGAAVLRVLARQPGDHDAVLVDVGDHRRDAAKDVLGRGHVVRNGGDGPRQCLSVGKVDDTDQDCAGKGRGRERGVHRAKGDANTATSTAES